MTEHLTTPVIEDFIRDQLSDWQQAADNYGALRSVRVKSIDVDGMHLKAQFNPARIVSSSAKIDSQSLEARKCFLCETNRPAAQRSLDWGGRYSILVNPFPIFPRHLTITDKCHCRQTIVGRMSDMLNLASCLEGYTVFYNGPRCGASAPDHMHFQAGNSDFLTLEENLQRSPMVDIANNCGAWLRMTEDLPLNLFVIDAMEVDSGADLFRRLADAMPSDIESGEPMLNILSYSRDKSLRVVIVPRKRHRPSFYGLDGDDAMLISPASVDMGGVFVLPREKDFERFDADTVRLLYGELCLNKLEISKIASNVK